MIELGVVSEIAANAASMEESVGALGFVEGAIAGGMLIGAALLAGVAVLQRGSKAFCALILVASASVLQFTNVGVIASPGPGILALIQGVFAASILVFLTASIRAASENRLFGGAVFAAALSIIAISVINIVVGGDISGLMRTLLTGVGGFAVVLSLVEAFRGDNGARLILPGVLLAGGAVAFSTIAGGLGSALPGGLFAIGILGASLVAFIDTPPAVISENLPMGGEPLNGSVQKLRVSENELAQVLDYSGLAIWDWSPTHSHQTESFGKAMGASCDAEFSPDDFKAFIQPSDYSLFEHEVFGREQGDGGFDFSVVLHSGEALRMRGARAIDGAGTPERIVMFLEQKNSVSAPMAGSASVNHQNAEEERQTFGNVPSEAMKVAIENSTISAAFQPIVSLKDREVLGFEGLLRLPEMEIEDANRAGHMAEVIRTAQKLDRSAEIGATMIKLAVEKHAQLGGGEKFVSVNFSRAALIDSKFTGALGQALDMARNSGLKLVVEITESDRGIDMERLAPAAKQLSEMGVSFSLDDFGAGFTRLADLTSIKFDHLKIDKVLVSKLGENNEAQKVVRSLTGLARDLGIKTIAEGIETEDIAKAAIEAGCDYGQGYLFGEPKLLVNAHIQKSPIILNQDLSAEPPTGRKQRRRLFGSEMR